MSSLPPTAQKPCFALALGAGVARGFSHIGVLKALDEAKLYPDMICGTSMGAVVGGCYLAGHLPLLEDWARGLTKTSLMRYCDFRIKKPGLIGGKRLEKLLNTYLEGIKIEDLPRPFAAVCTNLLSGHEKWLQKGDLVQALQASYALPGVFPPVTVGSEFLVDGALTNPVPVSVARAMGAGLVLSVNVNGDTIGKARQPGSPYQIIAGFDVLEEVQAHRSRASRLLSLSFNNLITRIFRREPNQPSLFGVTFAALGIMLDRITRSRMAGDPPDLQIIPKNGHIGLAEFHRAGELIDSGYQAVQEILPELHAHLEILGLASPFSNRD